MPDLAGQSGQADWPTVLQGALPQVDLFVPSVEELLYMLDRARFDELSRRAGARGMLEALDAPTVRGLAGRALELGAKVVLIKLGVRGMYLRTAERLEDMGRAAPRKLRSWEGRELWVEPLPPAEWSPAPWARGMRPSPDSWRRGCASTSPVEALDLAAATGASCVEEAGAVRGVQSWEKTKGRIAAGWSACR